MNSALTLDGKPSTNFLKAAAAFDRAAASGSLQEEMANVFEALRYREEIQIALTNQALATAGGPAPRHERLPLRDENGDDYGEVQARIPKALFFGLRAQENFGDAGLSSDDGLKDLLKAFPVCRTKTVSGKITSGYASKRAVPTTSRPVVFGRGTLTVAT